MNFPTVELVWGSGLCFCGDRVSAAQFRGSRPQAVDDIDDGGGVVVMINRLLTKGERAAKQVTAPGRRA